MPSSPEPIATSIAVAPVREAWSHDKTEFRLPREHDRIFLTDGGLETTLMFHQGIELPCFAAFVLLRNEDGRRPELLRALPLDRARLARGLRARSARLGRERGLGRARRHLA